MRDSDSRKSSRNVGASASSKPESESMTTRLAFSRRISLDEQHCDLVDRQIRGPGIDQADAAALDELGDHGIARSVGALLEGCNDAGLAAARALGQEGPKRCPFGIRMLAPARTFHGLLRETLVMPQIESAKHRVDRTHPKGSPRGRYVSFKHASR